MTATSLATGRSTAAALDLTVTPRHRVARPPVVYFHGVNGDASQPMSSAVLVILRALAAHGFPIVVPTISAYWDNATGQTRIANALTYARASLAATADPAILVGASHGAGSALHWAAVNPTLVAAVVGIIPAIDYQAIRVADTAGLRASIDTAWGVTYPAALPVGANPSTRTADLQAIPIQLWTASDDAVSANASTFDTALPLCTTTSVGALGHTETAIAAVTAADVVAFVQAAA